MTTTSAASPTREIHVEHLLGRRVRDIDGIVIGRIEELVAERVEAARVVTEFHVGPAALLERVGRFMHQLPLINALPLMHWEYRIPWQMLDLSDPNAPRVRCRKAELVKVRPEASASNVPVHP